MLPKKNRISRALFPLIITNNQTNHSLNMYMRVARLYSDETKNNTEESRFSFVIPKKAVKKAVSRNKLQREGYNIIQKNLTNIKQGYLIGFFFKKNISNISKAEIENEIIFLLNKARLFKLTQSSLGV